MSAPGCIDVITFTAADSDVNDFACSSVPNFYFIYSQASVFWLDFGISKDGFRYVERTVILCSEKPLTDLQAKAESSQEYLIYLAR